MLPKIKINYENGNLGIVNPSADGLLGLICTGAPELIADKQKATLSFNFQSNLPGYITTTGELDVNKKASDVCTTGGVTLKPGKVLKINLESCFSLTAGMKSGSGDACELLVTYKKDGDATSSNFVTSVGKSGIYDLMDDGLKTEKNIEIELKNNSTTDSIEIHDVKIDNAVRAFELKTPYGIRKFSDLQTLGITEKNNPDIVKIIKDFYAEAEEGTKIFLMAFPEGTGMSQMLDWNKEDSAKKLLNYATGEIRGLIVSGTEPDIAQAMMNAQLLSDRVTESKYAPIFTIFDGEGIPFNGNSDSLIDLNGYTYNRVGVFIGETTLEGKKSAIGLLAGRIAKIPVQRNIGRVKDGAVATVNAYIGGVPAESADSETIHNKGYITFRTFTGRSGYFFSDDVLATKSDDDYCFLARRRTIDKAYRIAYNTLIDELLDEIPVNEDGTLQAAMVRSWQGKVESAISRQMTINGELSADSTNPNDKGVKCEIDHTQNVLSNSKIDVNLKVRPFGYARYIHVNLGFTAVKA